MMSRKERKKTSKIALILGILALLASLIYATVFWILPIVLSQYIKGATKIEINAEVSVESLEAPDSDMTPSSSEEPVVHYQPAPKKARAAMTREQIEQAIAIIDGLDNRHVLQVLRDLAEFQITDPLSAVNFILDELGFEQINAATRRVIAKSISPKDLNWIIESMGQNDIVALTVVFLLKNTIKDSLKNTLAE